MFVSIDKLCLYDLKAGKMRVFCTPYNTLRNAPINQPQMIKRIEQPVPGQLMLAYITISTTLNYFSANFETEFDAFTFEAA